MTELPLVVIMDYIEEALIEKEVLKDVARVEVYKMQSKLEEIPQSIEEAKGVLAWHLLDYGKNMLSRMKNASILVRVGIGIDTVDLQEAGKLGIYVANVPDYGVEEVADSAMSHLLNLMRCTLKTSYQVNKNCVVEQPYLSATRLRGSNLGLVGFGKIGRAVALRAKSFGLNVYFYDPYIADGFDKSMGVDRVDTLKELIQISDIISLHCWLDEKNKHLINKECLSWIKSSGCYFVNTARGGLVDENALLEAVKDGRIKGAALDVTEHEPYPSNGPLIDPNLNVIVTPHSAFFSKESFAELRTKAAMEIKRVLQGNTPRNCVNERYLENPRTKRI